jgi:hypothetical protein
MIYGYKLKEINEIGLLEMKEITFAAPSDVLREIARFLENMARQIDEGTLRHSSHRHIGSVIVGWDKRFPDKDIIVIPPAASSDDTSKKE